MTDFKYNNNITSNMGEEYQKLHLRQFNETDMVVVENHLYC